MVIGAKGKSFIWLEEAPVAALKRAPKPNKHQIRGRRHMIQNLRDQLWALLLLFYQPTATPKKQL